MNYPQLQDDYDVAAPQIQCDADKVGAKIYRVPSIDGWLYDSVRVLAFDEETAVSLGRRFSVERDIPRYLTKAHFGVEVIKG